MLTVNLTEDDHFKTTIQRFSNPMEVKDYILSHWGSLNRFTSFQDSSATHRGSPCDFRGGVFLEDSLNFLEYGNDKEIERLKKEEDVLFDKIPKESFFMDMEGFAYDMGAVVSGEPEYCVNAKMLEPSKDIVITFSLSAHGGIHQGVIQKYANSILKLCNHLMENNYIVQLKYLSTSTGMGRYKRHMALIDIPLEYAGIANIAGVCSVDFFRNIIFLFRDIATNEPNCNGQCQGYRFGKLEEYMRLLNYDITPEICFDLPNFYEATELNGFREASEFDDWVFKKFEDWKKQGEEK